MNHDFCLQKLITLQCRATLCPAFIKHSPDTPSHFKSAAVTKRELGFYYHQVVEYYLILLLLVDRSCPGLVGHFRVIQLWGIIYLYNTFINMGTI